uniref:Ig-like domain-containing protein n=1 Tax=Coturnix japonica TaxID=93934 RepID=A0A8C2TKP7_COTJA
RGYVGEQVVLKCSFKSSFPITESLTIDWTYRPLTGGRMETVSGSVAYPPSVGKFKDRISWVGDAAKGDASIAIQNPTVSDNGTFICSVKNPPDVYHNIPQTVLIVTEREPWLHASAGDSVLLHCLFQDPEATGWTVTKVDWLRVPRAGKQKEEMVFYYYSNSSVPVGRFQGRVRWQGDVSCWDGSIQLQDVQVNDSGRYTCEIRLFQHGSIFKNHTFLHVSPEIQRGVSPSLSPHLTLTKGFPYLPAQFCSSAGVPVVGSSPALVSPYRQSSRKCPSPGPYWSLGCDRVLQRCGRGSGFPGRTQPEEEVPTFASGLLG